VGGGILAGPVGLTMSALIIPFALLAVVFIIAFIVEDFLGL